MCLCWQGVQVWWCVTMLVVSEDPSFLAIWASIALQAGLLVWPTQILAITHISAEQLEPLTVAFSQAYALTLTCPSPTRSVLSLNIYICRHAFISHPGLSELTQHQVYWIPS